MNLSPPCSTHRDRRAGWTCGTCGAQLCAESCAAWRKLGQGTIEVCRLCGGAAHPVRVRRGLLEPFGVESLQEAVRWPFHREGLLTAFACAVVIWLMGKAGLLAGYFGFGVVLAVCFHVTRSTARGEDQLRDAGDFRGFFEDVIGPLLRASFAGVWAYGRSSRSSSGSTRCRRTSRAGTRPSPCSCWRRECSCFPWRCWRARSPRRSCRCSIRWW